MDEKTRDMIVERVIAELRKRLSFEVEVSGRHVHLSREHVDALFGRGHTLVDSRGLSQPGEFLCAERVALVGPKGMLENVAILGPEREKSQVELSVTDATILGVRPPVRDSGDIEGSASLRLRSSKSEITLERGVIVAHRHIHMTPRDAVLFGVADGERVSVRVDGSRPAILEGALVRVSPHYRLAMHIDFDESNACGYSKGVRGTIVRQGCEPSGAEFSSGDMNAADKERLIDAAMKESLRRLGASAEAKPPAGSPRPEVCGETFSCADLRAKKVLAERDVQEGCADGCGELLVAARAIITPLAMDWLRCRSISVRREGTST